MISSYVLVHVCEREVSPREELSRVGERSCVCISVLHVTIRYESIQLHWSKLCFNCNCSSYYQLWLNQTLYNRPYLSRENTCRLILDPSSFITVLHTFAPRLSLSIGIRERLTKSFSLTAEFVSIRFWIFHWR